MNSSSQIAAKLVQTTLNPNAAEFIPLAVRSSFSSAVVHVASSSVVACSKEENKSSPSGKGCSKSVLNRTDSTNSNASDDECRQYWRSQLPDDITPDFGSLGEIASGDYCSTSNVVTEAIALHENSAITDHAENVHDRRRQSASLGHNPWELQPLLAANLDRQPAVSPGNEVDYLNELVGKFSFSDELAKIDPVDLLVKEFPGFALQSLVDIYRANGGDLNLTIDMLTQLELHEEGDPRRHMQQLPSTNLNKIDFSSLSRTELVNEFPQLPRNAGVQQPSTMPIAIDTESSFLTNSGASGNSRGIADFAALARKNSPHSSIQRPYELSGSNMSLGLSRTSQNLGVGSFARNSRVANRETFGDFSNSCLTHQSPQTWLETGGATANIYSELHEEAQDATCIRNALFEQARQAYLVGNNALAKELNSKGQWENNFIKTAHQRNLSGAQQQGQNQGLTRILDLHGLHVNEAIPLLKHELATIRVIARCTQQQQQIFISVGTGHHTKGSQTPTRLLVAVERYLVEEHLNFTEPQLGMFRVLLG